MYFRIYNLSILKQIAIEWQSQQFNFEMPRRNRTKKPPASAGNRTRVTRVAGEYSTTRPPMRTDRQPRLEIKAFPTFSHLRPHLLDIPWPVKRTLKCN